MRCERKGAGVKIKWNRQTDEIMAENSPDLQKEHKKYILFQIDTTRGAIGHGIITVQCLKHRVGVLTRWLRGPGGCFSEEHFQHSQVAHKHL